MDREKVKGLMFIAAVVVTLFGLFCYTALAVKPD